MRIGTIILAVCLAVMPVCSAHAKNSNGEFVLEYKLKLQENASQKNKKAVKGKRKSSRRKKRTVNKRKKANLIKVDVRALKCEFLAENFLDSRANKETIGTNFSVPLRAQKVDEWLENLSTDFRKKVQSKSSAPTQKVTIKPEMVRLYAYAQGMNLLGVIAVKVNYEQAGNVIATKYYRGFAAKANWANGIGEYNTAVNKATENLLPKIINDLPMVCGGVL